MQPVREYISLFSHRLSQSKRRRHEHPGRWQVAETPGAYIRFDADRGEFAFDCLAGSHFWSLPRRCCRVRLARKLRNGASQWVTDGPNCRMTAHSKAKSASSTATTFHSSRFNQRLLQQPASESDPEARCERCTSDAELCDHSQCYRDALASE